MQYAVLVCKNGVMYSSSWNMLLWYMVATLTGPKAHGMVHCLMVYCCSCVMVLYGDVLYCCVMMCCRNGGEAGKGRFLGIIKQGEKQARYPYRGRIHFAPLANAFVLCHATAGTPSN